MSNEPTKELQELSEEEKEIEHQKKLFDKFPKLNKWALLFTDPNNKATYGNRTESAMQSYNCKDRISAAEIGAQNFRKLKGLLAIMAEHKGFTVDKMLDISMARSAASENPKWFEITASMLGIYDPRNAAQTLIQNNINQQNTINISESEQTDFNEAFRKFIDEQ